MFTRRDARVCPECGATVEPSAKFCDQCNAPLSSTGATTRLSEHVSRVYQEPPEQELLPPPRMLLPVREQARPSLMLLGLMAIVLIGLGIGIGSFMRRTPPPTTPAIVAQATGIPIASACIVPNTVGQDQSAATGLINGVGLQIAKSVAYDASTSAGIVVSQEPQAGMNVPACQGQIAITVSLGPEPEPTALPPTTTPVPPTLTPEPTIPPTPEPTATAAPTSTPEPKAGDVLYEADWSSGKNGWNGSPDWKTINGMLVNDGTGSGDPIMAPYQTTNTADYAVEAEIQLVRGDCENTSFRIFGRAQANGEAYSASVYGLGSWCASNVDLSNGATELDYKGFAPGGDWRTYRIELQGNTIRLLIDGGKVLEVIDNRYLSGIGVGLSASRVTLNVRSFKVIKL